MWKFKSLRKRAGAFFLAAALVAGMMAPISVSAEGETSEEQTTVQTEVQPEEVQEKEVQGEAPKDDVQTSDEKNYDTTPPEIEEVVFEQNGKVVNAGETLKLQVKAWDSDSGISYIKITGDLETKIGDSVPSSQFSMNAILNEEKELYEATYKIPENTSFASGYIEEIMVVDNASNIQTWEMWDEEGSRKYTFQINPAERDSYTVKDFQFDGNKGTYRTEEDTVELSYQLEGAEEMSGGMDVVFEDEKGQNTFTLYAYKDEESERYVVNDTIDSWVPSGKYFLKSIHDDWTGPDRESDISGIGEVWIQVEQSEEVQEDTEEPKITSIELRVDGKNVNGQIVKPGTTVTLMVKAEDNVGLSEYTSAYMHAAAENVDDDETHIPLEYDKEEKAFKGSFEITDKTYPCEWYMSNISISDLAGNTSYGTDFRPDFDSNYPYYVIVNNGNTFVNPQYDVSVEFDIFGKNGDWETQSSITKKDVERRATLKEAGIELPNPGVGYKGLTFKGWADSYGNMVDEETQITGSFYQRYYAVYDKTPVVVSHQYVGKDGKTKFGEELQLFPGNITNGELEEMVVKNSVPEDSYNALTFEKWELPYRSSNPEQIVTGSAFEEIRAIYNKNIMTAEYQYVGADGTVKTEEREFYFEKGTTYKTAVEKAMEFELPENVKELKFTGWEATGDYNDDEALAQYFSETFNAAYEGVKIAELVRHYVNEESRNDTVSNVYAVKEGTTYREVVQKVLGEEVPPMLREHKVLKWEFAVDEEEEVENYRRVYGNPKYENVLLRWHMFETRNEAERAYEDWIFHGKYPDGGYHYEIVDFNEEIVLPSEIGDFTNLHYTGRHEDTVKYFATGDDVFYAWGDKNGKDPEKPTDPEKPVEPEKPVNPEKPTVPEELKELSKEAVEIITGMIKDAGEGETLKVDMGNATVVPKNILEVLKGKDVNVQFNMGGYTWTINGKDIKSSNLKDINLEVKVNADAIPGKTVQALAGDNPTCQLSLTHDGAFGFKANLTLNVGAENQGKFGNLFYYDSTGKMIYRNSGKIAPSGNVTLSFDHASDYVIVMSDEKMSEASVPESLKPGDNELAKTVKTGDNAMVLPLLLLAIVSVAAVVWAVRRRRVY